MAELLQKALKHPNDAKSSRVNGTTQTRVKEITIDDIKAIPAQTRKKKKVDIMSELKSQTTMHNGMQCPHKQRKKDKAIEKDKIKNKKHSQKIPIQPPPPVIRQLTYNAFSPPYTNAPVHPNPVYMYPDRNIRLPFAPMANRFMPSSFHIFDNKGKKLSIDQLLKGDDGPYWNRGLDNELGRLSNGIPNRVTGTKTINFIHKKDIPTNKKVTYANIVCDYRKHKEENIECV